MLRPQLTRRPASLSEFPYRVKKETFSGIVTLTAWYHRSCSSQCCLDFFCSIMLKDRDY